MPKRLLIVGILLLIGLGSLEPLDELLSALAHLLANRNVDVLLASLLAKSLEGVLRDEIVLVVLKKNGRDLRDEVWLLDTNETLSSTEEGLLVTLRGDHTLQHDTAGLDLLDDVLVKDGLCQNSQSPVLGLDVELLGLEVDLDILDLGNTTLGLGLLEDPLAESIVGTTSILTVLLAFNDKRVLQVIRKSKSTSFDGGLGHVDRPLNLLLSLWLVELLGLGVDATGELIVASGINLVVAIVVAIVGATFIGASTAVGLVAVVGIAVLLSLLPGSAFSLLSGLVLLALLGSVLQDERRKLLARIGLADCAASLAVEENAVVLDVDNGLGVLAAAAEDKLFDEAIKVVLQLGGFVCTVDNPAVVLGIDVGLSSQLETKVLDYV